MKGKVTSYRITPDIDKILDELAEKHHTTKANVIQMAILRLDKIEKMFDKFLEENINEVVVIE